MSTFFLDWLVVGGPTVKLLPYSPNYGFFALGSCRGQVSELMIRLPAFCSFFFSLKSLSMKKGLSVGCLVKKSYVCDQLISGIYRFYIEHMSCF